MKKVLGILLLFIGLIGSVMPVYAGRLYDPVLMRFTTPDPALNNQQNLKTQNGVLSHAQIALFSTSSYVYTFNNPLRFIDINGRWPTNVHNTMINRAFSGFIKSGEMTKDQLEQIKNGSAKTDGVLNGNQNPSSAYKHAMRSSDQNIEEAQRLMTDFIKQKEDAFINAEGDEAYGFLGEALHPIMDSTSPEHEGFQEWGLNPQDIIDHINGEYYPTKEDMDRTVEMIREFYLKAMEKKKEKTANNQSENSAQSN
jgi:RHS repeat-associated protein